MSSAAVRPGQVRLVVVSLKATFGPPLAEAEKVEVTLTVDAGAEDEEVKMREGGMDYDRGGYYVWRRRHWSKGGC